MVDPQKWSNELGWYLGANPQDFQGYALPDFANYPEVQGDPALHDFYGNYSRMYGWSPTYHTMLQDQMMSMFGINTPGRMDFRGRLIPGAGGTQAMAEVPGMEGFPLGGGGFDAFGFPTSERLPEWQIAPQVQMLAERQAAQTNWQLGAGAFGRLGAGLEDLAKGQQEIRDYGQTAQDIYAQGLGNMQTYRPGGASSLLSGMYSGMAGSTMQTAGQLAGLYGQRAGLFGGQANTLMGMRLQGAPDLMFRWREEMANRERRAAAKASNWNMLAQGIGTAASAASMFLAEGGKVEAQPGGQDIVAGEGGEDEYVVPRSKMKDFAAAVQAGKDPASVLGGGGPAPTGPRPGQVAKEGQTAKEGQAPQSVAPPAPLPGGIGMQMPNLPAMKAAQTISGTYGVPPQMAVDMVDNFIEYDNDMRGFMDELDRYMFQFLG